MHVRTLPEKQTQRASLFCILSGMSFCMYCTAGEGNSWQINVTVYVCVCALKEWSHAPCDESYTGWLARERLADWLEAVTQETHQLCTVELRTPVRFQRASLTFLLTDIWFAAGCKIAAFTCYMLFWCGIKHPTLKCHVTLTASFTPR